MPTRQTKKKRDHTAVSRTSSEDSRRKKRPPQNSATVQPPGFWDELATLGPIYLTRSALREFNRRNRLVQAMERPSKDVEKGSLEHYAQDGGPDITDIRGVGAFDLFSCHFV